MAEEGANVAILYAGNETAAAQTVQEAEAFGVKALSYRCDVSSEAGRERDSDQVLKDFGRVDILVNNAGIVRDGFLLSMKEKR